VGPRDNGGRRKRRPSFFWSRQSSYLVIAGLDPAIHRAAHRAVSPYGSPGLAASNRSPSARGTLRPGDDEAGEAGRGVILRGPRRITSGACSWNDGERAASQPLQTSMVWSAVSASARVA
jgi:hypothetical protein